MSVQNGILRPQQVTSNEHKIESVHTHVEKDGESEAIVTYRIDIKCVDSRLTDLLARLVSGVLFSNSTSVQNAEENILREMGKWNDTPVDVPVDITKEPESAKAKSDGN